MRHSVLLSVAVSALIVSVGTTLAADIHVDHVWARASAGAALNGAAYFTIVNDGAPDRLVGIATPVAASAELHETLRDNGVMKMRPVPGLALVPGQPVTLEPGGYHVMMMGLKQPLRADEDVSLTLTFEHAQPITVTAKVQAVGATRPMGHKP